MISMEEISKDFSQFHDEWLVIGLGTTNWYRRNGETIVDGLLKEARFFWTDPTSEPIGKLYDLKKSIPTEQEKLITPMTNVDHKRPLFPFMGIAVCDPADSRKITLKQGQNLHETLETYFSENNIGLAAVKIDNAHIRDLQFATGRYLPIGGLDLSAGYSLEQNFSFGEEDKAIWNFRGLYSVNPTIQDIISISNHPLHLHGYEADLSLGGHVKQAILMEKTDINIFPVKDIKVSIKNLDVAVLPINPSAENGNQM